MAARPGARRAGRPPVRGLSALTVADVATDSGPVFIDVRALVPLTTDECLTRLRAGRVGRVAFASAALPAVVPVTYATRCQHLLLATAADSRLAKAADGNVFAFEIDEINLDEHTGW